MSFSFLSGFAHLIFSIFFLLGLPGGSLERFTGLFLPGVARQVSGNEFFFLKRCHSMILIDDQVKAV
jgi:hypothetical protein